MQPFLPARTADSANVQAPRDEKRVAQQFDLKKYKMFRDCEEVVVPFDQEPMFLCRPSLWRNLILLGATVLHLKECLQIGQRPTYFNHFSQKPHPILALTPSLHPFG